MGFIDAATPAVPAMSPPWSAALDPPASEQAPPAASRGAAEFVCNSCGYGIRRTRPPHHCPMCQASDWREGRATGKRPSSAPIAEAILHSLAKRGANRMIHEVVPASSSSDPISFFCECGDPNCHTMRWLTADAFEHGCTDPAWHVLAPGHPTATSQNPEQT